jgi:hypothetical protein
MAPQNGPVEVHFPDGGRLTITGDIDSVIEAVVHSNGGQSDVEEAIRHEAESQGLSCTATGGHDRTIVDVRDR